jgi:hypothetical protein
MKKLSENCHKKKCSLNFFFKFNLLLTDLIDSSGKSWQTFAKSVSGGLSVADFVKGWDPTGLIPRRVHIG